MWLLVAIVVLTAHNGSNDDVNLISNKQYTTLPECVKAIGEVKAEIFSQWPKAVIKDVSCYPNPDKR